MSQVTSLLRTVEVYTPQSAAKFPNILTDPIHEALQTFRFTKMPHFFRLSFCSDTGDSFNYTRYDDQGNPVSYQFPLDSLNLTQKDILDLQKGIVSKAHKYGLSLALGWGDRSLIYGKNKSAINILSRMSEGYPSSGIICNHPFGESPVIGFRTNRKEGVVPYPKFYLGGFVFSDAVKYCDEYGIPNNCLN